MAAICAYTVWAFNAVVKTVEIYQDTGPRRLGCRYATDNEYHYVIINGFAKDSYQQILQ